LQQRREEALQLVLADPDESDALSDLRALDRTLGNEVRKLEAYDRLPANDPRRQRVGGGTFQLLVTARRYEEAVQTRAADSIMQGIDHLIAMLTTEKASVTAQEAVPPGAAEGNLDPREQAGRERQRLARERFWTAQRAELRTIGGIQVEIFAGAGRISEARTLIGKLLSAEPSPEMRAGLRQHLERVGHPELLAP
jgi:hypothetical protein